MKTSARSPFRLLHLFAVPAVSLLAGCADLNSPYNSGYGNNYPPPYYGGNSGYYGNNYPPTYNNNDRRERRELERERERLEEERQRLENERERHNTPPPPPAYRPPPPQERCPSGFSPSEQKCSREERKHGCRDMRLPGGLGCVSR